MILFIHGFASCGLGEKSKLLIDYFGQEKILTPDLSHIPKQAIKELDVLCQQYSITLLVGSSLGGFYASWLCEKLSIPAVLINPAVKPYNLLDKHIGKQKRWCDSSSFNFTIEDAEQLKDYEISHLKAPEKYLVLLQQGDEILDYRDAANTYKDCKLLIEKGGNHRFENLKQYLPLMDKIRLN